MRKLTIHIPGNLDIPLVLSDTLGHIGSLNAPANEWSSVLIDACDLELLKYDDVAVQPAAVALKQLCLGAYNRNGAHNAQGNNTAFSEVNGVVATFVTAKGVRVDLRKNNGGVDLTIDFNRESTYLATVMLGELFRHRVPGAAALLSDAAKEASQKESEE